MSSRRPTAASLIVAGAVLTGVGPAPADAATGWERVGPPPGIRSPAQGFGGAGTGPLDVRGSTVVTLDRDPARREPAIDALDSGVTAGTLVVRGRTVVRSRLPPAEGWGTPAIAPGGIVVVPALRRVGTGAAAFRTADGGRTWRAVRPPRCGAGGPDWSSVAFDEAGSGIAVGGGDSASCVWASHDAGASWRVLSDERSVASPVSTGVGRFVAIADAGGERATVVLSVDGGRSWVTLPLPAVPALPPPVGSAPSPPVPPVATSAAGSVLRGPGRTVVVGTTSDAILRSDDAGASFRRVELPVGLLDGAYARSGTTAPIAALADGSVLLYHDLRLVRLRADGTTAPPDPFRAGDVPARGDATVGLRGVGGRWSLARDLGGPSPTELLGGHTEPGNLGAGDLIAVVRDGALWRSSDGGARWRSAPVPEGLEVRAAARRGRDTLVLDRAGELHTVSPAGSWRPVPGLPGLRLRALGVSSGALVAVGDGGIARWTRGRLRRVPGVAPHRWTRVTGSLHQLVAATTNGRLTRSVDDGRTWHEIARAGTRRPVVLAAGGRRTIMVVAERRLWTSTDGGGRFRRGPVLRRANEGWSGRPGSILVRGSGAAIVAAYGRLLRTDDAGRTVRAVSLPHGAGPEWVADGGGSRLLVQDDLSGDLLRGRP